MRKFFLPGFSLSLIGVPFGVLLAALFQIQTWLSPLNARRPPLVGNQPEMIILHTTEGGFEGALNKLRTQGEAHYLVGKSGRIVQLIEETRIARHSGRSLWDNRTGIDQYAIGIEIEGYHNEKPEEAQLQALRWLIADIRSRHPISDQKVLTHSMVAYGTPNRYQNDNHRGRKRCGMWFTNASVRKELGLGPIPSFDPDVEAGRLVVADPYLQKFIYSSSGAGPRLVQVPLPPPRPQHLLADLSSEPLVAPKWIEVSPPPPPLAKISNAVNSTTQLLATPILEEGNESSAAEGVQFREVGDRDGATAWALAGRAWKRQSTIYFLPDGRIRTGRELHSDNPDLLNQLPRGTLVLVGYFYGGKVSPQRSVYSIVRHLWNSPSTVYYFPDRKIKTGDEIDPQKIPLGTIVLFER